MEIRPAGPTDASAIRAVHELAFPTRAEADLVEALADQEDCALSLVAIEEERIVGHILFSRMRAEADGRELSALGLGPLAVVPRRQRRGIGSALVDAGLAAARESGAELVFLVGEPDYYRRFGFTAATAAPFASPYAGRYFQAVRLGGAGSTPVSGRADYAPAFASLG